MIRPYLFSATATSFLQPLVSSFLIPPNLLRRGTNYSFPSHFTACVRAFYSNMSPNLFTVCDSCQGLGKHIRPPSRKSRHKRSRVDPPPPRTETCIQCLGSGLMTTTSYQTTHPHMPHVAIVGGGVAGLALATACRHRGIPHTVFERDMNFAQRSQGYGLTLQQASKALKGFGMDSLEGGITSTKHVVHETDGTVVGEWGLRKWGRSKDKEPRRQNVHITRQGLRHQLWMAAGNDNIRWNHKLLHYNQDESSKKLKLTFKVDGEQINYDADLIVGADGIRSQVRQQLIGDDATPLRYLGCIVILGICPLQNIPVQSELLDGETVFQMADGITRIYAMPFTPTEYMWQLSFTVSETEALRLARDGLLHQEARRRCDTWHSPVSEMVSATPPALISGYPVYDRALLTLEQLNSCPNVTLMGDACHPMSPFKGQGANQALLDALSLGRVLYKNFVDQHWTEIGLEKSLQDFSNEMLTRSAIKVQASAQAAEFLHSEVAIQKGDVTRAGAASQASKKSLGIPSND